MEYNRVTEPVIAELKSIVGSQNVLDDPEQMLSYSHDEATGAKWRHLPEVVVKPQNTQQISAILKLANQERIPVTPRGAGSGLAAGAVPFLGGILLTLEKMNRIIELDRDNMFMVVEPGVTTAEVQQCAREAGLFYAGDPCSADSSFIGGNVATNAGGNKAIRYGVTGQHVFGLEVVLADGQVAVLGGKTIKEVSGYNLIQLMIGSEGTLGVITKIYLKLQPRPQFNGVIMAPFASIPAAIQLVPEMITKSGIIPTSIEFMDNLCIKAAEQFLNKQLMFNHAAAYIIIELDGNSEGQLLAEMEMLAEQCYRNNALDVLVGDNAATQERIWKPRRVLAEALRVISPVYSMEDIVVPITLITWHSQVIDFQYRLACLAGAVNLLENNVPGYHHMSQSAFIQIFDVITAHYFPTAQNSYIVRYFHNLVELMSDKNHCFTLISHQAHGIKQFLDFLGSQ